MTTTEEFENLFSYGTLQREAVQLATSASAYSPRKRWVGDAAAYNRSDVRQRLASLNIPTS